MTLNKKINLIKLYFSLATCLVISFLTTGSYLLRENDVFTLDRMKGGISYLKYRMEFNNWSALSVLTSASASISRPVVYIASSTVTAPSPATLPVLVYHGILLNPDSSNINISAETFKEQMFALKNAGYNTVTSGDILNFMRGKKKLPPKSLVVTFDDGRVDSYHNADPILAAVDFKAIMFVITKYSLGEGNHYYLSKNELKTMASSGRWDIEVHTQDGHNPYEIGSGKTGHFYSDKLWLPLLKRNETDAEFAARVDADFQKAKDSLSQILGTKVLAFAFPFGDFGQNTDNYPGAKDVILNDVAKYYPLTFYQNAPGVRFTSNYFLSDSKDNKSFLMRRMDVSPDMTASDLMTKLENSSVKKMPYSDDLQTNRGWVNSWGQVIVDPRIKVLIIRSGKNQTGGAAILDGTRTWQDYSLSATVNIPNHQGVYAWVRFQDDQNNAACNFGQGFVHIEQTVDGKRNVIKGINDPNFKLPEGDFGIGTRVRGRSIECLINGRPVVSDAFLDPKLNAGGIGFKIWDTDLNNKSILLVKSVDVWPL